jgi:hypothetical protein
MFKARPSSGIASVITQTTAPIIGIEQPKTKQVTAKWYRMFSSDIK